MRYSTPGMNQKRNLYWFYLLFFMKRMNPFIEGSEKNGFGSPEKWLRISCGNYLKDTKEKIVVFASNNIMEAVRLIRNQIQAISYISDILSAISDLNLLMSSPDGYAIQLMSRFKGYAIQLMSRFDHYHHYVIQRAHQFEYFIFQGDQIGNDTLNHRTRMKYTINQHLSNLKKSQKKGFDSLILISRSERSMNRDPDAYRYKCFNGSNYFQEHFEHFVSEQKRRFQVVFDRLRINQDWIDWSKVINKKNDSKSLLFLSKLILFLSNSLPLFFVSLGNMPIHRSEIHIYELKGPNDQLCNPLLKSLGLQIVHLKKWKAEDHDTSQKSKLLINGRTISPFLFNKIPKWKWMIDSFHTRKNRRRSFDNTDSYFSMIFRDQDSWLNPVKAFHRSSLISSFYKANRLRFLNNPHHFFFYCNKGFPFYMEKARINNYDFTYRQFLNILFIRNKIFSLCVRKKKHAFLERDTISPIESTIFIPNDFPQRGDERYNLYKSFHFPIRSDLFVRRTIYSIADISGTPLTEEEIVNLERTYCQPLSDMSLSEEEIVNLERTYRQPLSDMSLSEEEIVEEEIVNLERTYRQPLSDMSLSEEEGKNLHQYLNFNSNMGLIHTPRSEKYFPSEKRKKRSLRLKKCVEKGQMDRIFQGVQRDSDFSTLLKSKWNLFQTYMPWFLTSTGYKYLNFLFLDTFSDLLSSNPKFGSIFHDIMRIPDISWGILKRKWRILERRIRKRNLWEWTKKKRKISEIPRKCFHKLLLNEERIHRNNESPLISTNLSSPNVREFLYSILLLLLLAGYLVHTHLVLVSRTSSELQTELKRLKSWMSQSYKDEFKKLQQGDYARPSESVFIFFEYLVVNLLFFPLEELIALLEDLGSDIDDDRLGRLFNAGPVKLIQNLLLFTPVDLIFDFLSFLPDPIDRIPYLINTIHLSHTSKEMDSWRREENRFLTRNGIEFSIETGVWVFHEQRDCLIHSFTLRTEKGMNQILLSLTHSDHLLRNDSGYPMFQQPGAIYLRYLVDIHKKDLLNYEVNTSCLAERQIFLAHYQTIAYSQFPCGGIRFDDYKSLPFSLGLGISPPRGILVIGSRGTGRAHLVQSLATTSYLPFIKVFLDRLFYKFIFNELDLYDTMDALDEADIAGIDLDDDSDPKDYMDALNNVVDIDDGFDISDDIYSYLDLDLDLELEELTLMEDPILRYLLGLDIELVCIDFQFEFVRAMCPCIVWIPNIHDLYMFNVESLAFFLNYLSRDCERRSTRNILVIASTYLPHKVDPALIAPTKLDTCIKIRRLPIPQQRKHLFTLSYTRGFRLEKTMFHTNSVGSTLTMGYNARDLVGLNHQAVSMSIAQSKSIIDTNTVRLAFVGQTWLFRERLIQVHHGILFYQIGRAVVQHGILSNYLSQSNRNRPLDLISIYMTKQSWHKGQGYLSKWFFELATNIKKFTLFIYLLSSSAGSVAQDLWSLSGPDAKNWAISYGFILDDSVLVDVLVHAAAALEGCLPKDRVTWPGLRNPFDLMQDAFFSFGRLFIYEASDFLKSREDKQCGADLSAESFFLQILWAPRMWQPGGLLFDWYSIRVNPAVLPYWAGSFRGKPILSDDDFSQDDYMQPFSNYRELIDDEEKQYTLAVGERRKRRRPPKQKYSFPPTKYTKDEFRKMYSDGLGGEEEAYSGLEPALQKRDPEAKKLEKNELKEITDKLRGDILDTEEELAWEEFLKELEEIETAWDFADLGPIEQIIFYRGQPIWYPGDPLYFLSSEHLRFSDDEYENTRLFILMTKGLSMTAKQKKTLSKRGRFIKTTKAHYLELFCNRQKGNLLPNLSSLDNESFLFSIETFRSTMKIESYQHLSNLFLSNVRLFDQVRKTFWRKTYLFPEEVKMELKKVGFM
uniref:hypothetical chloroplast RF2 n=1 Tax=Plumbago zeylanica TaxID=76149 RepID=UPI002A81791A|nr:hypothetical chloroplast RF2 [Plumbago zeylanica]WPJ72713.1 hypothetical chloroplast RF2 [Plumbago zeylanica]